jgi:hypothetical protein
MVFSLFTGKPIGDPEPATAPRTPDCLFHYQHGWTVDRQNKKLQCQKCGAELDPYDALARIARDFESVQNARKELTALRRQLDEACAEERRTKDRTKRAARKDAETAVAEARKADEAKQQLIADWADEIGVLSDRIANATGKRRYSRRRSMET